MNFHLKQASWDTNKDALSYIRRKVFIEEQNVPEALEWDEYDNHCIHILVTDDNSKPVATGRMKDDGHIGRMAVLKEYRKLGIGRKILNELISLAIKKNLKKIYLHAQTTAIPFYQQQGFETCSEEFMDAGIPHKSMQRELTPKT